MGSVTEEDTWTPALAPVHLHPDVRHTNTSLQKQTSVLLGIKHFLKVHMDAQKKALNILVLVSSITTCTDITFHNVNSGWAGFEIKRQWSRNLADFIIIINKLSNFSSVQQQQKKKKWTKKTNQSGAQWIQTNKSFTKRSLSLQHRPHSFPLLHTVKYAHTSPSVGCNRSSGMSCTAGRRLGTLWFKNKQKSDGKKAFQWSRTSHLQAGRAALACQASTVRKKGNGTRSLQ